MNFDQNELNKFDQQAAYWWDKNGPLKSLHDINPIRLRFIRENLGNRENLSILDVGCGGGILSETLASLNATVTGIDANDSLIQVAKLHALESKITIDYIATTAEDYLRQHNTFDAITCMELLEHVPDPASLIKTLSTLLKPNGKIFFSTINRSPASFVKALIIAEHILKLLPKGTHDYKKFIKPSELQKWCIDAGIEFKSMTGMGYNPVTKNYYLTNNIKVNYLVYARRDSFDLDGTLLDTAHDLTLAVNDVVQRYQPKKSFTLLEARRVVGYGSEAIFHELIAEYVPHMRYETFRDAFREAYLERKHEGTAFFDGVVQLLEQLNRLNMPWGIVTNKTEAGAKQAVEHFSILKTAHCVVGCDTAGHPKPSAAPLLYASEQLHFTPQQCLFVGDTIIDMEAAHHANMPVIAVGYGYGTKDILQGKFQPIGWIKSPLDVSHFL